MTASTKRGFFFVDILIFIPVIKTKEKFKKLLPYIDIDKLFFCNFNNRYFILKYYWKYENAFLSYYGLFSIRLLYCVLFGGESENGKMRNTNL